MFIYFLQEEEIVLIFQAENKGLIIWAWVGFDSKVNGQVSMQLQVTNNFKLGYAKINWRKYLRSCCVIEGLVDYSLFGTRC